MAKEDGAELRWSGSSEFGGPVTGPVLLIFRLRFDTHGLPSIPVGVYLAL